MRQLDVTVIGDALMDHQYWVDTLPKAGEDVVIKTSQKNCGGSAANTAIALALLGVKCAFCGRLGNDEDGKEILFQMKSAGVDTSGVQFGQATGYTLTIIDKSGERTMFSYRGASGERYAFSNELEAHLSHTTLLLLSGYMLSHTNQGAYAFETARTVKSLGGKVALDPSPMIGKVDERLLDGFLSYTDILLPNQSELMTIANTDDVHTAMMKLNIPCIALKRGNGGASLGVLSKFNSNQTEGVQLYNAPAQKVQVVDTTGAGDAFNAGFLSSYLYGRAPQEWIETGNRIAAAVIAKQGASYIIDNCF